MKKYIMRASEGREEHKTMRKYTLEKAKWREDEQGRSCTKGRGKSWRREEYEGEVNEEEKEERKSDG